MPPNSKQKYLKVLDQTIYDSNFESTFEEIRKLKKEHPEYKVIGQIVVVQIQKPVSDGN